MLWLYIPQFIVLSKLAIAPLLELVTELSSSSASMSLLKFQEKWVHDSEIIYNVFTLLGRVLHIPMEKEESNHLKYTKTLAR